MEENLHHSDEGLGIQWLDYLAVLWKYRLLVGALFLTSLLYGSVSTLLSPRVYEATVTIIKVNGGGEGVNLLSLLVQQFGATGGISSQGRGDNTLIVLRSRSTAEEVVKQLNLQQYYGVGRLQDAAGTLRGSTKITPVRNGPIEIKVEDKDPQKAAEIANSYAGVLNRLLSSRGSGLTRILRRFVEERLKETALALRQAEEALKTFQEKKRVVVPPSQTTEAIGAAAGLRGQLVAAEVQLQQVRTYATESNPDVLALKRRITELKRQIAQAQYGGGVELPSITGNPGQSQKEIYLPAAKVPETMLEFTRLQRDIKVQEGIYTALTQQLEQAKISEAQDAPSVEILDPALPPGQPKSKKMGQTMAIYGLFGVLIGVALSLALDYSTRNWPTIKSLIDISRR